MCPPASNNTLGTCNEACSGDSDCSDGQLCCSNGCGHECMSPDPCAVSEIMNDDVISCYYLDCTLCCTKL